MTFQKPNLTYNTRQSTEPNLDALMNSTLVKYFYFQLPRLKIFFYCCHLSHTQSQNTISIGCKALYSKPKQFVVQNFSSLRITLYFAQDLLLLPNQAPPFPDLDALLLRILISHSNNSLWLSWRFSSQIFALSPPRLAVATLLSKTALNTPFSRSPILKSLIHSYITIHAIGGTANSYTDLAEKEQLKVKQLAKLIIL